MMPRMRGRLMGMLVAVAVAGGCDAAPKTLSCGQSIAAACATSGDCVLSWDQAATGTAFCSALETAPPMRADCGAYHVVTTITHLDAVTSYYYDMTTGMLVAIIGAYAPSATDVCVAGPPGGFALPTCTGPVSESLPPCIDAGTDAASD
jgi:hypothetical protein